MDLASSTVQYEGRAGMTLTPPAGFSPLSQPTDQPTRCFIASRPTNHPSRTRAGLHSASDDVPVPLLVLDFGFRSQVLLEFAKRDRVIYCTCNLTAAMHFSVCKPGPPTSRSFYDVAWVPGPLDPTPGTVFCRRSFSLGPRGLQAAPGTPRIARGSPSFFFPRRPEVWDLGRIVFPAARARLFRPDSSGFPSATPIGDPAPRSQATGARSAGPSRVRDLARGVWR